MCGKKRKPLVEPEVPPYPDATDFDAQVFYWRQCSKRYIYLAKKMRRVALLSGWRFFRSRWKPEYLKAAAVYRDLAKAARVSAAGWAGIAARDMQVRAIEAGLSHEQAH